jgi:hypothetical protein
MTTNDLIEQRRLPIFEDPENFPGKSLWQPWAGLIWLAGMGYPGKELETRKSRIHYRGNLVICAAHFIDFVAFANARRRLVDAGLVPADLFDKYCGKDVAGNALALFEVTGCRPMTTDDHTLAFTDIGTPPHEVEGKFVWEGGTISALTPFATQGAQGFSRVPKELALDAVTHSTTWAKRVADRAKAKASDKCQCGSAFPAHLAHFMNDDERAKHVCSCSRTYVVKAMKFVAVGTDVNPFVEAPHGP